MRHPHDPRVDPLAEHFLGIPFKIGGRDKAGADCLGVAFLFLRAMGIPLPDPWSETNSVDWACGLRDAVPDIDASFDAAGDGEWYRLAESEATRAGDFVARADGLHVSACVGGGMILTAIRNATSCLQRADQYGESTVWRWRPC